MSNKKRISKKIQKIEMKKISRFIFCMDSAGKYSSLTVTFLCKIGDEITKISNAAKLLSMQTMDRKVQTYISYQLGVDFETINNPKFQEFLHNIKCLSGESLMFQEICLQVPPFYYSDVEGMMRAGFKLQEAVELLKETYKF